MFKNIYKTPRLDKVEKTSRDENFNTMMLRYHSLALELEVEVNIYYNRLLTVIILWGVSLAGSGLLIWLAANR